MTNEKPGGGTLDVFFYGLFMDIGVLNATGVSADFPRRAIAHDIALVIGNRATLMPSEGGVSYGMVFSMLADDVDRLYSGDGLEDYRPGSLMATYEDGSSENVVCYTLPDAPDTDAFNRDYAARLQSVLGELGFPDEYIAALV